ncbi:hypothetical protein FXF51_06375 [Nonomuraea sp. PA05]|uniref:hypothetical protein n=1 Tax=Nonomuraea sp. PA05 TaxID=2604466 RepID=UPI0011D2FB9E|nr:hypothetical protein [Nonomuraea sp. PA05]TYB69787.1 hypothetical protein FXF51_06375 [Nonomuraea sp. PA05]
MTIPSPQPRTTTTTHSVFAALEHTFPAWEINVSRHGMWSAVRVQEPTPQQLAAGLLPHIVRRSRDDLVATLIEQLLIAQGC